MQILVDFSGKQMYFRSPFSNGMEALVFFVFFGLYIFVRVLFGGGASAWDKQSEIHKEGLRHFKLKQWKEARQYFDLALVRRPYDVLSYVILAEIALHEGETEKALLLGQKGLRLDNTIWQAHFLMARAETRAGLEDLALRSAEKAVWFGRNQGEAHLLYGSMLLQWGKVEKGLRHMAKAYALGEEDAGPILRNKSLI
jgi:tetratricopeptide (TPR) repeat protein